MQGLYTGYIGFDPGYRPPETPPPPSPSPPPPSPPPALPETKPKKPPRQRAQKIEAQNFHYELVLEAARVVTEIFRRRGISCAVFGSLASRLYGTTRTPKVPSYFYFYFKYSFWYFPQLFSCFTIGCRPVGEPTPRFSFNTISPGPQRLHPRHQPSEFLP